MIIVVACAGMTFLDPGMEYGVIAAAGEWFVRFAPARVRPGWIRLGQRFYLLVCAGQAVVRTVSVAVRAMGRLDARGHGHMADRVGAANAERQRLRRSAAI